MTTDTGGRFRDRHRLLLVLILLVLILLVTFAAYGRSLWNDFTYDDRAFVMVPTGQGAANPMVAEVQDLTTYFTRHYGHGTTPYGRGFRPVTVLSFAVVNALAGPLPRSARSPWDFPAWPQHLVNILLHLLGVVLTYALLARFTGPGLPALLGAAVFGLHALRSDPVISIVGRAEILGYVFGAGATLCYVRRSLPWLLAAAVLLFLACCSKENAMAWIVFAPLYALALGIGIRSQLPILAAILVPGLAAFGLWLCLQLSLEHHFQIRPLQNPLYFAGLPTRILTGVMLLGYGLYKVLLPLHLACDYGSAVFELVESIFDYRFWIAALVLGSVLVGGLRSFRQHPLLFLGMACFLGFGFMTSNIPVGVETIFAERVYYTPAAGLSFLVAWLALRFATHNKTRTWLLAVVATWCVVGGLLIFERCTVWRDNDSLFLNDVEAQPRSLSMHLNVAECCRRQGEADNWQGDWKQCWHRHLWTAHSLDPEDPIPLISLASHHLAFGEIEEAQRHAGAAKDAPKLVEEQDGPDVYRLLAAIAEERGELKAAEDHLLKGVELWPHMAAPHIEHALFLKRTNRPEEAEAVLENVVDRFPRCEPAWMMLVELVRRRKDKAEEQALMERARAADPKGARIALALGLLHHEAGRFQEAADLLEEAYWGRLEEEAFRTCRIPLAESLGKTGRKAEALEILEEALAEPKLGIERRKRIRALKEELGGS